MLRLRLDPDRHGSAGFTSLSRLLTGISAVAVVFLVTVMVSHVVLDGRLMPGVEVADRPMGGYTLQSARASIAKMANTFALQIKVEGKTYKADASQIGLTYDISGTTAAAYSSERQSWLPWPARRSHVSLRYTVSAQQLDSFVNALAGDISHPPTDAQVQITNGQVAAIPSVPGMSIDKRALVKLIVQDIQDPSGMAIQPQVRVMQAGLQANDLTNVVTQTKKLITTPMSLNYAGRIFTPTVSQVGDWVTFSKEQSGLGYMVKPVVSTDAIAAYVASVAKKINVSPLAQEQFVDNGTTKIIRDGRNGVVLDQASVVTALASAVTANSPLNFSLPTETVPYSTVSTDLTPLNDGQYIEINLTTQHLYAWQSGQVVYDSPITSGATGAGFATVTGMFHIFYKATNTHLVGYQYGPAYNYDVFVQYWMPFYEGYGLHDASWRHGNFGGPDYYYGGSHGCVNLPLATAAFLYGWAGVGTPVWVHN